jgi:hypothetical protein
MDRAQPLRLLSSEYLCRANNLSRPKFLSLQLILNENPNLISCLLGDFYWLNWLLQLTLY